MQRPRFIVGLILIAAVVLIFVFGEGGYSTSGAIGLGVLGLVMVSISRKYSNQLTASTCLDIQVSKGHSNGFSAQMPRLPNAICQFDKVPPFKVYWPSVDKMNDQAKRFYLHWKDHWEKGEAISVEGNISYLFVYLYDLLDQGQTREVYEELKKLLRAYRQEKKFAHHIRLELAKTHFDSKNYERSGKRSYKELGEGDYEQALKYRKEACAIQGWEVLRSSEIVDLKSLLGEGLKAYEFKRRLPSYLTDLGEAYFLNEIQDVLQEEIEKYEKEHDINLLSLLAKEAPEDPEERRYKAIDRVYFGKVLPIIKKLARTAENIVRERHGLPEIGEGWVRETLLMKIVKQLIAPLRYRLIFHARPSFLQRQELDIYIPELKVGIEYMGRQHFEPVEFFGGKQAHLATVRRDEQKKQKCEQADVKLIYFRYDESLEVEYVRRKLINSLGLSPQDLAPVTSVEAPMKLPSREHLLRFQEERKGAVITSESDTKKEIEQQTEEESRATETLNNLYDRAVRVYIRGDKGKVNRGDKGKVNRLIDAATRVYYQAVGRKIELPYCSSYDSIRLGDLKLSEEIKKELEAHHYVSHYFPVANSLGPRIDRRLNVEIKKTLVLRKSTYLPLKQYIHGGYIGIQSEEFVNGLATSELSDKKIVAFLDNFEDLSRDARFLLYRAGIQLSWRKRKKTFSLKRSWATRELKHPQQTFEELLYRKLIVVPDDKSTTSPIFMITPHVEAKLIRISKLYEALTEQLIQGIRQ